MSVTGVKICYAKNKRFNNKKTITLKRNKTIKKIAGLKKGKTYYFKIRTYRNKNENTYYSDWSKIKKIKK